jgi:type II secretory pathway pseudopilin PulG
LSALDYNGGRRLSAFSLTELIGVLAVITIIAAVIAPVAIRRIDLAAKVREGSDLAAISNALVLQILSTKEIPHETNWAQAVANWTRMPVSKITTTPRRYNRAFMLDTGGWLSTNLAYVQSTNGTSFPVANARLMLISTMAKALPTLSARPDTNSFNTIWNCAEGQVPSGFAWAAWGGRGEDLLIQRINLEPLFHRLVLLNRDPVNIPRFTIDGTNGVVLLAGGANRWERFYLNGTRVGLCDSAGVPRRKFVLTRDEGFVFEGDTWSDYLSNEGSNELLAAEFADLALRFMDIEWASSAHQGADQQGSVVAMFNFMLVYTLWANQCPHFPWHGITGSGESVPEYQFLEQIEGGGTGVNASGRLNEFTGANGLLD